MSDAQKLPDKIRFHNHYRPILEAGSYEIELTQNVDIGGIKRAADSAVKTFTHKRVMHVSPRRFSLAPGDLHAVFPPANAEGEFGSALPHLVLRKRGLPWERAIGGSIEKPLPWLALLLFHDGEAPAIQTIRIQDVQAGAENPPADGVLRPAITVRAGVDDEAGGQTLAIDVPRDIFEKIAPSLGDISLLAHVRQTYTGDKELLGLDVDEWFSVVLSNRVPKAGLNTAHLVSLEGWAGVLQTRNFAGATKLRLVSLANWSFTEKLTAKGSFAKLIDGLKAGPLQVNPAELPAAPANDTEQENMRTLVKKALEQGYVPLAYDMRSGERTAGWYRGPLLPVRTKPVQEETAELRAPFESAEAGLIYDPRTGMFDVSFAVAWQMGRLLALASSQFASALSRWRQQSQVFSDKLLDQEVLRRRFGETQLFVSLEKVVSAGPGPQQLTLLTDLVRQLTDSKAFSKALAKLIVPATGKSPLESLKAAPLGTSRLSAGLPALTAAELNTLAGTPAGAQRAAKMAEFLTKPVVVAAPIVIPTPPAATAVEKTKTDAVGRETVRGAFDANAQTKAAIETFDQLAAARLPADLKNWLGQLLLLYGVPFENLVADQRMLPAESLRFFYLDRNWLQAAVDGAFSVGAHSKIDTRLHRVLQDLVLRSAETAAAAARAEMRDETPTPEQALAEPAGLLMRSAIVSGWPGLEVQAFRFTASSNKTFATRNQTPVSPDGQLQLVTPAATSTITLTTANNNLDGLAAAINAAQTRVTASVVPAGPFRLSVTFKPLLEGRESPLIELRETPGDPATNILASFRLPPLRIERLAPDILLCIFPDIPNRVEINEPAEGLHFGLDKDNTTLTDTVTLRNPETGFNFSPLETAALKYRGGLRDEGVIDVSGFATDLATKLAARLTRTPLGAADFGVQMVHSAQKRAFEPE